MVVCAGHYASASFGVEDWRDLLGIVVVLGIDFAVGVLMYYIGFGSMVVVGLFEWLGKSGYKWDRRSEFHLSQNPSLPVLLPLKVVPTWS
jgi:hypothetical protein